MYGIFSIGKLPFQINIITIILLSLIKGLVSLNKEHKLIAIKQLTSIERLFVILDTGIYLYEQDLSNFINIYEFNSKQQTALRENKSIKPIFSLFRYKGIEHYSCLLENYLFIYNPINKLKYYLDIYLEQNIEPFFMKIDNLNLRLYLIK